MSLIVFTFILWYQIKQSENEAALSQLGERLSYIDSLEGDQKQTELVVGLLSGNLFDWGAKAVVQIMEMEQFGLTEARKRIPCECQLIVMLFFPSDLIST